MNLSDLTPEERIVIRAALDHYADWLFRRQEEDEYSRGKFETCLALMKKLEP